MGWENQYFAWLVWGHGGWGLSRWHRHVGRTEDGKRRDGKMQAMARLFIGEAVSSFKVKRIHGRRLLGKARFIAWYQFALQVRGHREMVHGLPEQRCKERG